jgi:hypothetical protein
MNIYLRLIDEQINQRNQSADARKGAWSRPKGTILRPRDLEEKASRQTISGDFKSKAN